MDNLFKGLESMGLTDTSKFQLYASEKPTEKKQVIVTNTQKSEALYQRKVECPVCNTVFMTTSIRSGRIRFIDTELDLRPIYSNMDPIKYDVVVCSSCGYAHLNKFFKKITDSKMKSIITNITPFYKGKEYKEQYSYDDAIERYKLALLNAALGYDTNGVKAYICLKLSWLYRGKREELVENEVGSVSEIEELMTDERHFVLQAYKGFLLAYEHERFPIVGIEQGNMEYLIAELARRLGDFVEARKWLSRVIQRKNTKRLSDKIFEVKERIKLKETM